MVNFDSVNIGYPDQTRHLKMLIIEEKWEGDGSRSKVPTDDKNHKPLVCKICKLLPIVRS